MNEYSLKFIRYGLVLCLFGLLLGYLPLGHYLMSDSTPSCPSAPIHGHVILLSLFGMSVFGLLYKALPAWVQQGNEPPLRLIRMHFLLSVVAIVGVAINGTVGYEFLNHYMQQGFYYLEEEGQYVRNIWFAIDGIFLTLYAAGVCILTYIFSKYAVS